MVPARDVPPDLCERCVLPDCDERSDRCLLRQVAKQRDNKRRCGRADEITHEEREAYNAAFHIWKLEDRARKSEAPR